MKEHRAICKAAGKEVPLPVNPILMAHGNISPSAYVLETFKGIRIHFGQITSNQMLVPVIEKLKETTISKVRQVQDAIGFNMAGLDYLKRECEAKSEVMFFAEATSHLEEKKKKRKNRKRMILTLT